MASWREIERLRKAPDEFRGVARALLASEAAGLNDWETDFLNSIVDRYRRARGFTLRQTEVLLEIKNKATPVEKIGDGFSVAILLRRIHEGRDDLSDADEEWIARVRARSLTTIRGSEAPRLLRLALQLSIIEAEYS